MNIKYVTLGTQKKYLEIHFSALLVVIFWRFLPFAFALSMVQVGLLSHAHASASSHEFAG